MSYFTFKGISSEDMGLRLISLPPPSRAEKFTEAITIPGRPRPLMKVRDEFTNFEIEIECIILDVTRTRDIFSWLSGSGRLIYSDEPDKYYTAVSNRIIEAVRVSDEIRSFTLAVECLPFAYAVDNDPVMLQEPGYINVSGTYPAAPVWTIYGNGKITLNVNNASEPLIITDTDGYIVIDTEAMFAYKWAGTSKQALVNRTKNKFPLLAVGTNSVSWTGNVSRVECVKNERWL